MKTIEERAKSNADRHQAVEFKYFGLERVYGYSRIYNAEKTAYEKGAKEQKVIDIENACNIFCHTGCPHKTDSYNCLNDKCDTWKIFRRMLEEEA